jgi:outer membrane protein OmpA-like peptidoglycan-associated protein
MRKTIAALAIISLCAATSAAAEPASKEENIGVGSGALIGAAAGGPVGLVIGAAIGAKIGDKMHRKNTEIESLDASLENSRSDVTALQGEVDTLNDNLDALSARLAHVQSIDRPALVNLLQAGIAMDLLFRTDEHALADTTGARLAELASSVAAMPDIRVQLDGFADERGDADYNLELSQKRVEFVRDQLVAAGIEPSRIRITAHGEAPAQDDSVDSYALERRVSLKLFIDDSPSFAATP